MHVLMTQEIQRLREPVRRNTQANKVTLFLCYGDSDETLAKVCALICGALWMPESPLIVVTKFWNVFGDASKPFHSKGVWRSYYIFSTLSSVTLKSSVSTCKTLNDVVAVGFHNLPEGGVDVQTIGNAGENLLYFIVLTSYICLLISVCFITVAVYYLHL